jgi:hypothetical protein
MDDLNIKLSQLKLNKKPKLKCKKCKKSITHKKCLCYNLDNYNKEIINDECYLLVNNMKLKENNKQLENIIKKIEYCQILEHKCILAREYLSPQSTQFEKIIKKNLLINDAKNETSGDGYKNNIKYEIKCSIHSKKCKINFVQIRPDHDIDFYILITYNMYYNNELGKAYVFKIPSYKLYELIVDYGGYAHGTVKKLGNITINNIKGRNCEYALRCNPNCKKGKNYELWNKLIKYTTDYRAELF